MFNLSVFGRHLLRSGGLEPIPACNWEKRQVTRYSGHPSITGLTDTHTVTRGWFLVHQICIGNVTGTLKGINPV